MYQTPGTLKLVLVKYLSCFRDCGEMAVAEGSGNLQRANPCKENSHVLYLLIYAVYGEYIMCFTGTFCMGKER